MKREIGESQHRYRISTLLTVKLGGVIAVYLLACGDNEQRTDRTTAVDSLPTRALEWQIDTIPAMQIGVVGGAPEYQFTDIKGIAQFQDSSIIVLEGSLLEVRQYDIRGRFLRTAGRSGAGPSEFRSMQLFMPPGTRTIGVADLVGQKIVRYGPDLRMLSTERIARVRGRIIGAVDSQRVVLVGPRSITNESTVSPANTIVMSANLATGTVDTVVAFEGWTLTYENGGSFTQIVRPFEASVGVALLAEKTIVTSSGYSPHLQLYDFSGARSATYSANVPVRRVTTSEWNQAVEKASSRSGKKQQVRSLFKSVPKPEAHPIWGEVQADELRFVWVETLESVDSTQRRWLVFTPEGDAIGTIQTPRALKIWQIGKDFVLGQLRDKDDVVYVRRYSLKR